jgi:hypothetical protein
MAGEPLLSCFHLHFHYRCQANRRSVAILPSAFLNEPLLAPCQLGVLVSVGAVKLCLDLAVPGIPGNRILDLAAVTRTRRLILSKLFLCRATRGLCRRAFPLAMIAKRFVDFSAHPQLVQQHCQLSGHRHHSTFLGILPSSRRQLQPPPPQIAIFPKWSQDVLRALYQQHSQVAVSFLAYV